MEASLIITAVFNNQILVEKFLEEATDDIRDSMQFRLVNKTFRDACHSNFRKNHRDLIIEFVKSDSRDGNDNPVYINNRSVSSADSYFLFLKNVAKVRIQSIVVKDLWQLAPSTQLSLHDSIRGSLIKNGGDSLKKLIGMDEICPGNCEDCVRIPKECVEYGPLQFEHLMELFTKPRVFEKLIVPDYLLDDIANSCIACSASEDDCFKAIHDFIPSNSSCKVLVLKISESRKDLTGRGCRDHKAMPQEVIDFMLKQWSVQSVVLEFVHETHWIDYKGEWARKGWFTGLCFSDSRDRLEKSSIEMEASLIITAVFNNQILVEKFLEEATDDIRDSMQFRLVKRTFRDACHAILRRNQRETKIEYIKRECKNREEYLKTSERVYINYHPFKISNVENYFHLLKNVANVNIETVVTKNLWKLKKSFQKTLHNYITNVLIGNDGYNLSQLIGMDEICKEPSEDFFVIPNNCVEYGPLRIDHLKKSFPDPREFEKLIVTDYLLDDIANSCIESSNSKEDCYKTLSDLVPSNISCKTLILKISEGRKQWRDPNQNPPAGRGPEDLMAQWIDPYKQREMPREVLEFMLKQWAVQSISLKFVTKNHQDSNTRGEWTRNAWFTKLCFKDFMETKEETDFKVKEVLVDLTDSCCLPHFRIYGGGRGMQPGLVSNIRKVFFCDKVIIRFPHVHPGSLSIEDITEGIMNDIFSEEQEKLDVEVIYYSRTQDDTTYFIDLWNLDYEKLPQVFRNFDYTHIPDMTPEWHYLLEGHDFNKVFVKKEWIGSGCRMINRRKKCTVEWKTFVEKNPLRMERSWNGAMHAGVFGMF